MIRKLSFAALLGLVCTFTMAADGEKPGKGKFGGKGKFDKGMIFDKMDSNSDGKVTKEEYTKFFEAIQEKFKDKIGDKGGKAGDFVGKMYEKLDPKGAGSFTKEEFENAESGFGGFGGDKGGKFKGKGDKKKPAEDK